MNGNQPHNNIINIDNCGFTLIEVMIALAIFSIGILGMYALQISSINGNTSARNRTQAIAWAANRICLRRPLRLLRTGRKPKVLIISNGPHPRLISTVTASMTLATYKLM